VYRLFRQLENGELLHVASHDELEPAVQLVNTFNAHWPGGYVVRDSEGIAVVCTALFRFLHSVEGDSTGNTYEPTGDRKENGLTVQVK
jgi:hypothetical protein